MNRLSHFLQYHNAVPVALGILILGGGGVFAATNPEAIYSSEETVVAVDNTYIANKDLTLWSPKVQITAVTEDAENYYVAYTFTTIALDDSVWKDIAKEETMTVSKPDLGQYRDLGLYVMAQLKQKIDREIAFLKEVQEVEKKSVTQKTVATAYGGLVGGLLDDTTEILPGYTPIVTPPQPVASVASGPSDTNPSDSTSSLPTQAGGSIAVQILGNNPARIEKGVRYADLGAIAFSASGETLFIDTYLDGNRVDAVSIDTSIIGRYVVRYAVVDNAGGSGSAERTIEVFDPYAAAVEVSTSTPSIEEEGVTETEISAPVLESAEATSTPSSEE